MILSLAEEEAEEVVLVLLSLTEALVVAEEEHALRIACWLFLLSQGWSCF